MNDNRKPFDLSNFIARAAREELDLYNIRVWQDNRLTASHDWRPAGRLDIRSGTKSITSMAVGFAVQEGLFSLEDPVAAYFADELPEKPSENLMKMKVKHLLTMTMGFEHAMLMGAQRPGMRENHRDWVRYVLADRVLYRPGEKFLYNNAGPYLLSVLIKRKTGMDITEYLKPRLFDPLGLEDIKSVEHCPMGYELGCSGILLDVEEFGRLGLLYLQDGRWNGRQVLPRGWVRQSAAPHAYAVPTSVLPGYEPAQDSVIGAEYGYFIWIGPWGKWYYFSGANDNVVVVVPEHNAVVAVAAHVVQPGNPTLHAIAQEILPYL